MTQILKIGFDLDDVCWNLLGAWVKRHNELHGDVWKFNEIRAWTDARNLDFRILEEIDFWKSVKPKAGSQETMKRLMDNEHELYIVTASPYQALERKMDRFFDLYPFMEPKQIIITQDKQMINLDVLVDDNPLNLESGEYERILFTMPHNESFDEKSIHAKRCEDWNDIQNVINEIVKNRKE